MENTTTKSKLNSPLPVKVNTLEQLLKWFMVDGEVSIPNPEDKALTLVIGDGGYMVGIAQKDQYGYQPANIIVDIANYHKANELVDEANKLIFKRTPIEDGKIVCSSFNQNNR